MLSLEETSFNLRPHQYTLPLVQWMMIRPDQTASLRDMAEAFNQPECAIKDALNRLLRVNRVSEIHPNIWHLE